MSNDPISSVTAARVEWGGGSALRVATAVPGHCSSESLQLVITSIWDHHLKKGQC